METNERNKAEQESLPRVPPDAALRLVTERMYLEPVVEDHAEALWKLFRDPLLHVFVPFEVPTLESQKERCEKWARRISPQGDELWLNWVAFLQESEEVIGHFQAGIKAGGEASIGYLISREKQGQGFATEGLRSVLDLLRRVFSVRVVRAWTDTRNTRSHRLVERLGMKRAQFIKDADFFKGASSDEWVYETEF